MHRFHQAVPLIVFALFASRASAQTTVAAVTGHWEGSVHLPDREIAIVVDLTNEPHLSGVIGMPSQQLTNLPLQVVTLEGDTVAFHARQDQRFSGALSTDGASIAGAFRVESNAFPFTLKRVGPAKTYPALVSAPVTAALAGHWVASVADAGVFLRATMALTNRKDGTARGLLVNETQGGLQIPLTIVQRGREVSLAAPSVGSEFHGTLNEGGTELNGAWTQGATRLQLTFVRRMSGPQ